MKNPRGGYGGILVVAPGSQWQQGITLARFGRLERFLAPIEATRIGRRAIARNNQAFEQGVAPDKGRRVSLTPFAGERRC